MAFSVDQAITKANYLAKQGRADQAAQLFKLVLEKFPRNKRALDGLSALSAPVFNAASDPMQDQLAAVFALLNQGRLDTVLQLGDTLLRQYPRSALLYNIVGAANLRLTRLETALVCFEKAVQIAPNYAEAHYNMGVALQSLGSFEQAVACYAEAIRNKPTHFEAYCNIGNIFKNLDRPDDAIFHYKKAIQINPDVAQLHYNLGVALQDIGRHNEAVICYRKSINLTPEFLDAHINLGGALEVLGQLDEAVASCRKAVELAPLNPEAHNHLGVALKWQGQLDEAITCFQQAINLAPRHPEAHANLGFTLEDMGFTGEALVCSRRAVALVPDDPDTHDTLGIALFRQRRLEEAATSFRNALALKPNLSRAHYNLGMVLLAQGDMVVGWQEYEWRWKTGQMIAHYRDFGLPQWRGETAAGKTLLIHAEQGFGDTIQFCRYATLAAERGLRVILEVPKPLVQLLRSLPGVDSVVGQGEELPTADFQSAMLSLPLALGTTVETIPCATPYLFADATAVEEWRSRLAALYNPMPRIGLVWAGNPRIISPRLAAVDRRRSMPPEMLTSLFDITGLHFFSLQKDGPAAPEVFPIINLMGGMKNFADTAALIANLDLVISVDTAVAHLAAALGKPVWLLNRFDSCWRWLAGRRDSPWYPTLRLYQQPQPGDWNSVMAEITSDLRRFVGA
ncbi:MAG: tetratricopeptide repeat protein [Formivibrio sp.]|nr:tetratricopeptide repeat protein [Formivibrio sp.]